MLNRVTSKAFAIYVIVILILLSPFCTSGTVVALAANQYKLMSSSDSGGINTNIYFFGNWTTNIDEGKVYFDINGNNQLDENEPSNTVTTVKNWYDNECYYWYDLLECASTSLQVPDVKPGLYDIRYISSSGEVEVKPIQYRVVTPSLTSLNEGGVNVGLNIFGYTLPGGDKGKIYFDSNNNGQFDTGEPSKDVQVSDTGFLSTVIRIPNVRPGVYNIRYLSSTGKYNVIPTQYKVVQPSLSLRSNGGGTNRDIGISGYNLPAEDKGRIYFDSNDNGQFDTGEPSTEIQVSDTGSLSTKIKIPDVKPGDYNIYYFSYKEVVQGVSASYRVIAPSLSINTNQGGVGKTVEVRGASLDPDSSGTVYFDSNNNELLDEDEKNVAVLSDEFGAFSVSLDIPEVSAGKYSIRYIPNSEGISVKPIQYEVLSPSLGVYPGSGNINKLVTIKGDNFIPYEPGTIYFDSNNNDQFDNDEKSVKVLPDSSGNYSVSLTIPDVAPGEYNFRYTSNNQLIRVSPVVYKVIRPIAPTVDSVEDSSKVVIGKAEADTTVEVVVGDQVIGTGTTDKQGTFEIPITPQKAATVLIVIAKDGEGNKSQPTKVTVQQDKTAPDIPKVNVITELDKVVTGKAEAGSIITIKVGNKELGTTVVREDGTFSMAIDGQKAGEKLIVTSTDESGNISEAQEVIVRDVTPPSKPTVNSVTEKSTSVTGIAEAGSKVTVKVGTNSIGEEKVNTDGEFKITIPVQKGGTILTVIATDESGNVSTPVEVVVEDKTAPVAPIVNSITDQTKEVTGETEGNTTVDVKANGKMIGTGKADAKGTFSITIPVQKAGTVVEVTATDGSKNVSPATKATVKDVTAPAAPTVNSITDQTKKVTGKTEGNATVNVKAKGKMIGTGKADAKGTFSIAIPVQKAGTVVEVTATDGSKNVSPVTKVTV
ncbi:Ig-like domain-containing protein, partial [Priestia megaterium]